MRSFVLMYWFLSIIIISFTFISNFSEARHVKKLPSAVVVGTVYCDTCFKENFSKSSRLISGALVAVECGSTKSSKPSFREEVKTNEHGEFKVHLPFSVSKHVKKIEGCSVKLLRSSEPYCAVASSATSLSSFHLKSKKQGTHIFSAGFFTFKPLNQPDICNQKPEELNPTKKTTSTRPSPKDLSFPPPIQDPNVPFIPPIPDLPDIPPLPNLPALPPVPKIPILPPGTEQKQNGEIVEQEAVGGNSGIPQIPLLPSPPTALGFPFPLNPLQPPSIFPPIPNPFQPPPSILPPIIPQPPPSLFPPINFPPLIPGLIPSPPPPPPAFPIPLPPFPFQPAPGFPGFPPSSPSNKASP